jgi:Flp pilus assembly protein TadD
MAAWPAFALFTPPSLFRSSKMKSSVRPTAFSALSLSLLVLSGCASAERGQRTGSREAQQQFRLAELHFAQGKNQEAIAALKRSINLDPRDAEVHSYLGFVYLSLSDFDGAEKELQSALKLNPYLTEARNYLGVVYMKTDRRDRAVTEFEAALKDSTFPNPEKILYNLGTTQLEEKLVPAAVESFRRAVAANSRYAKGYYGLALALSESGRSEEARVNFQKVISLDPQSPEAAEARERLARAPAQKKG